MASNALKRGRLKRSEIGKSMLETPARIEPLFFDNAVPTVLADLAIELQKAASELGRGLHPESAAELADLVRVMNSYYSNLIEGHNTRPRDIESALAGAEIDAERRPLALEAKAHVEVQRMIDGFGLRGGAALKSDTPKAPVRIAFPLDFRERLFPNLFTGAEVNVPEPPSLS
jgi:hypothetical protein